MGRFPRSTALSDAISKDMKKRGFKFFGTTICYAHMQAMGLVNDHTIDCYRHRQLSLILANSHSANHHSANYYHIAAHMLGLIEAILGGGHQVINPGALIN